MLTGTQRSRLLLMSRNLVSLEVESISYSYDDPVKILTQEMGKNKMEKNFKGKKMKCLKIAGFARHYLI